MTWNVEGLSRNIFNLKHFTQTYHPDLVFLSEPQIFTHDVKNVMGYLKVEYSYSLNTADKYDHELSLIKNRASGGTMVCWKNYVDPYVTPILYHLQLSSQSSSSLLGALSASILASIFQLLVRNISLWKNFRNCPTPWKN